MNGLNSKLKWSIAINIHLWRGVGEGGQSVHDNNSSMSATSA
jgi:hypothetical protein